MGAKCGAMMAKFLLFIFNFLFFAAGAVLIGVGAWIIANDSGMLNDLDLLKDGYGNTFLRNSAILLLSMGCFMIVVAIMGFVVAVIENPHLFAAYIICLVISCAGMIAGGVVSIAFKDKIIESLGNTLLKTLESTNGNYYRSASRNSSQCTLYLGGAWEALQYKYKCCGIGDGEYNGYIGYDGNSKFIFSTNDTCNGVNYTTSRYPFSCCTNIRSQGVLFNPSEVTCEGIHPNGCGQRLVSTVYKYSPVLIGIGLGFGMFVLFGIVFAVCLCQNPTKNL